MHSLFYDSDFGMGSLLAGGAIWTIGFLVFIVASVVMGYMFLSKNASKRDTKLGRFLCFDRFVIKKVIQVVNLICVVAITVISLCIFFSGLTVGLAGFFGGLIGGAVFFCVSQLLNRLVFEQVMLMVSITTDVKDLRNRFVGNTQGASIAAPAPAATAQAAAAKPAAEAPAADVVEGAVAPAPATAGSWDCACGKTGNTGKFCAKCGSPRS